MKTRQGCANLTSTAATTTRVAFRLKKQKKHCSHIEGRWSPDSLPLRAVFWQPRYDMTAAKCTSSAAAQASTACQKARLSLTTNIGDVLLDARQESAAGRTQAERPCWHPVPFG